MASGRVADEASVGDLFCDDLRGGVGGRKGCSRRILIVSAFDRFELRGSRCVGDRGGFVLQPVRAAAHGQSGLNQLALQAPKFRQIIPVLLYVSSTKSRNFARVIDVEQPNKPQLYCRL